MIIFLRMKMLISLFMIISCSTITSTQEVERQGIEAIDKCVNKIETMTHEKLSPDVDSVYVYTSASGISKDVLFSKGTVGTFGRIAPHYRLIWGCGISQGKIVLITAPLKNPLIDLTGTKPDNSNTKKDIELLFKREKDIFKFCCKQKYDPSNIRKHNPEYFKKSIKLGYYKALLPIESYQSFI